MAIAVITLLTILSVREFRESHFLRGTVIGEVDCSYMTVNKALNKVQQEAGEYTNKLYFIDGTTYEVKNNEIGLVFEKVLEDAGVFKRDEQGKKAFLKFTEII